MPEQKTLEDGTVIDVYSPDEIEQQKQQAIEDYKSANPDKTEEMQRLQTELEETKKSLAGLKDKDVNVGKLKEGYEKRIDTLEKSIDDKVKVISETTKKEVMEGVMKDFYLEKLSEMTGGDVELNKKIEYHYKRLADPTATKADVTKKLRDAFALATMTEGGSSAAFSSGGVSAPAKPKEEKLTEDDKDLLRKMGKGHLAK